LAAYCFAARATNTELFRGGVAEAVFFLAGALPAAV
jgi:hypothetical protein